MYQTRSVPDSSRPKPAYITLHDNARHAVHVQETLEVSIDTIRDVIFAHDRLCDRLAKTTALAKIAHSQVQQRLKFCDNMLRSLKHRSWANKERLDNEIKLVSILCLKDPRRWKANAFQAFHIVTQYDSRVSVQIGQAARSDGAAMKTLATLTMVFLPATFICVCVESNALP
jgi:hypothetical protein